MWGTFDASKASVDGNGLWLDQNVYGNVYAPDTGAILFQAASVNDMLYGNAFELPQCRGPYRLRE